MNDKTDRNTKLHCDTVRDLLPLYHDKVVSKYSALLIREHLAQCRACSAEYEMLCAELPDNDAEQEKKGVAKLLKRTRLSGLKAGIAIMVLLVFAVYGVWHILTEVPIVKVKPEYYSIDKAYISDSGVLVYYVNSAYPCPLSGEFEIKGGNLRIKVKRSNVFVSEEDMEMSPSGRTYKVCMYELDWITDKPEEITNITLNGRQVWNKSADGRETPEFVNELADIYMNDGGYGYSFDEETGVVFVNGGYWDMDGNPVDEKKLPFGEE